MEYISVKEAADKWGVIARMVIYHCTKWAQRGRAENRKRVDCPTPCDWRTGEKETDASPPLTNKNKKRW